MTEAQYRALKNLRIAATNASEDLVTDWRGWAAAIDDPALCELVERLDGLLADVAARGQVLLLQDTEVECPARSWRSLPRRGQVGGRPPTRGQS